MATKRVWKIAGWTFGILLLIMIAGLVYITNFLPKTPKLDIKIIMSAENQAKGQYLASHVMVCLDCHSSRDWQYFSGPILPGTEGQGGEVFDEKMGLPGRFISPNITPYVLKDWSDAEIFIAVTQGVDKNGRPLFPIMPYTYYGTLDREDIIAVISFIRSLPEIKTITEKSKANFPVSILLHLAPRNPSFSPKPNPSDSVAMGKYLVTAGSCIHCHTVSVKGELDLTKSFAGGQVLPTPQGNVVSANITPSKTTGIGNWEADGFVVRFKAYEPGKVLQLASNLGSNTIMPWTQYAGMKIPDLRSVFHYLKSIPPIENKIVQPVKN